MERGHWFRNQSASTIYSFKRNPTHKNSLHLYHVSDFWLPERLNLYCDKLLYLKHETNAFWGVYKTPFVIFVFNFSCMDKQLEKKKQVYFFKDIKL